MRRGTFGLLFLIILLALGAAFVDFWPTTGKYGVSNPFPLNLGLDLQGGVRVLLVPKNAAGLDSATLASAMDAAQNQITQRVNGGLGVKEPSIRLQTTDNKPSIAVELPGYNSGNQFAGVQSLLQTGTLEFWNTGATYVPDGTQFVPTQYGITNNKPAFTGKDLDPKQVNAGLDSQTNQPEINFEMQGDAIGRFATFTQQNVGNYLTVTLDRKVIQSANIKSAINGPGQITGQFTSAQANQIATVLRYGALPISLQIASLDTVGPTLGIDSINKSLVAAAIGLGIVIAFMLLYYRLPGFLADIALLLYALFAFAAFKMAGVTLTLAGIAGFILSIGMAVDANILIFERVKEELRDGRLLSSAIDIGWKRAWPSIRDSNISTMITCAVLYVFGNNFGASIIVGFASTLFLGVIISMFTAIIVTRTFLNLLVPTGVINHPALFGLPAGSIAVSTPRLARRSSTV